MQPLNADVFISSTQLNLDPILPSLTSSLTFNANSAERRETGGPSPSSFPAQDLNVRMDLQNVTLGQMDIPRWKASASVSRQRLTLESLEIEMNGGTLSGNGKLLLHEGQPPQFTAVLAADRLPVEALSNTLLPERNGVRSATLSLDATLYGEGFSTTQFVQSAVINLDAALRNISVDMADQSARAFLEPLAAVFNAPKLLETDLRRVGLLASVADGNLAIRRFAAGGSAYVLITEGLVPLQLPLKSSIIRDWPVEFFMSVALADDVQLLPGEPPAWATHVKMPNFIQLGGTLRKPGIEIQNLDLMGSILEQFSQQLFGSSDEVYLSGTESLFD